MATFKLLSQSARSYCVSKAKREHKCKLLIVGAGAGGCSVAWRFTRRMREHDVIVLEPSQTHYNQPLFTLVAAGIKRLHDSYKPTESVLPSCVGWVKDHAKTFDPQHNAVYTRSGDKIVYDYMVVALGLQNDYDKIAGLKLALDSSKPVCTIYEPQYSAKTWSLLQRFKGGHAVFTYPSSGGKCSGAAQKIMYLADDYWRKHKIRPLSSITFTTGAEQIFGVPKYAAALTQVAAARSISVCYSSELIRVNEKEAVFKGKSGGCFSLPYNFLHATPPMSPPHCLSSCTELATPQGYLAVDKHTLQHLRYKNVYGIGDCLCTPNSKTAAAVARQSYVLECNLLSTIRGRPPKQTYDGYGACPVLTSYRGGILAEFRYGGNVCETFPFDQSKERSLFYYLNKDVLPYLYWRRLLTGKFNGPKTIRRFINPFRR